MFLNSGADAQRRQFLHRFSMLAALASFSGLSACTQNGSLAVAIFPWIGYETLFLARQFNWLPANIRLLEGKSASDSTAALQSGEADAACLTLDEVLRARGNGIPLTVALVFDVSAGADALLARSSIKTLQDLVGKRIGVEMNALGALIFEKVLEASGLPASALTAVNLPPEQQLEAWRKGDIDAVIAYDPNAVRLQKEGAVRLFDSRQMPDTIFDVLAVRTDRLPGRDAVLEKLLAAHFKALEHLRTNREDALYRISAREGIQAAEVNAALSGIVLPSLPANRSYLAPGDSHLRQSAAKLSALMTQRRLLPREDDLENLLKADWLPRHDI